MLVAAEGGDVPLDARRHHEARMGRPDRANGVRVLQRRRVQVVVAVIGDRHDAASETHCVIRHVGRRVLSVGERRMRVKIAGEPRAVAGPRRSYDEARRPDGRSGALTAGNQTDRRAARRSDYDRGDPDS